MLTARLAIGCPARFGQTLERCRESWSAEAEMRAQDEMTPLSMLGWPRKTMGQYMAMYC